MPEGKWQPTIEIRQNSTLLVFKLVPGYPGQYFEGTQPSEINEARALGINVKMLGEKPLHTRLMYFDLIDIK